jgi:SAM-dependent methyltransferase
MRRKRSWVEPVLYDGQTLPFSDRCFPLVYAMDVLHHCADPLAAIRELLRCADQYVLIKDHTYQSPAGRLVLGLLDEIGNRRFAVPSLYRYQRGWEWLPVMEEAGFLLRVLLHPAPCHLRAPLGLTNRFQFVGLWQRRDGEDAPSWKVERPVQLRPKPATSPRIADHV